MKDLDITEYYAIENAEGTLRMHCLMANGKIGYPDQMDTISLQFGDDGAAPTEYWDNTPYIRKLYKDLKGRKKSKRVRGMLKALSKNSISMSKKEMRLFLKYGLKVMDNLPRVKKKKDE